MPKIHFAPARSHICLAFGYKDPCRWLCWELLFSAPDDVMSTKGWSSIPSYFRVGSFFVTPERREVPEPRWAHCWVSQAGVLSICVCLSGSQPFNLWPLNTVSLLWWLPTINLVLLLLHVCNFACYDHNVNTCFSMVLGCSVKRLFDNPPTKGWDLRGVFLFPVEDKLHFYTISFLVSTA